MGTISVKRLPPLTAPKNCKRCTRVYNSLMNPSGLRTGRQRLVLTGRSTLAVMAPVAVAPTKKAGLMFAKILAAIEALAGIAAQFDPKIAVEVAAAQAAAGAIQSLLPHAKANQPATPAA
jgi:hypothetical protein